MLKINIGEDEITLSDEQVKALEWDIAVPLSHWIMNFINVKIRQCEVGIIEETQRIPELLTEKDNIAIQELMPAKLVMNIKSLPDNVRQEIVKRSQVKSAKQREEELRESLQKGG